MNNEIIKKEKEELHREKGYIDIKNRDIRGWEPTILAFQAANEQHNKTTKKKRAW